MKWLREAYRGFLWPFLTFAAAVGFGIAGETNWSTLHFWRWPVLFLAIVAMNVTAAKVKRGTQ
jgi:anti-sigma-K factor RskA